MLKLSATPTQTPGIDIVPARKLTARVAGLYVAAADHFETSKVEALSLAFGGIPGDFHFGAHAPLRRPRAVVSAWHRNKQ